MHHYVSLIRGFLSFHVYTNMNSMALGILLFIYLFFIIVLWSLLLFFFFFFECRTPSGDTEHERCGVGVVGGLHAAVQHNQTGDDKEGKRSEGRVAGSGRITYGKKKKKGGGGIVWEVCCYIYVRV